MKCLDIQKVDNRGIKKLKFGATFCEQFYMRNPLTKLSSSLYEVTPLAKTNML